MTIPDDSAAGGDGDDGGGGDLPRWKWGASAVLGCIHLCANGKK